MSLNKRHSRQSRIGNYHEISLLHFVISRAHLSVKVEVGYGLGIAIGHVNSRPADVLVQDETEVNQLPLIVTSLLVAWQSGDI